MNRMNPLFSAMRVVVVCLSASIAVADSLPLSSLDLEYVEHLRSRIAPPPSPGLTPDGRPISIGGSRYEDGVAMRGIARWEIVLDGEADKLDAWVGVTDDSVEVGPVWFEVVGDGRILAETAELRRGDAAVSLQVDLRGIEHITLTVQAPDSFAHSAAWADASIQFSGTPPVSIRRGVEEPYIQTPATPLSPRINGALTFGARPGSPIAFPLAVSGERPMKFVAEGLPKGLAIDSETGLIRGSVAKGGRHAVTVHASNGHGGVTATLQIVIGKTLALTPPMGWNSWYCFGEDVTEPDIREAAHALKKAGLDQFGFNYVNIDDYWMTRPALSHPIWDQLRVQAKASGFDGFPLRIPEEDDPSLVGPQLNERGALNTNARFPDMPGLIEDIHDLGLRVGIYSAPGALTCGRCWGSLGHELEDARQFADWGIDLLKYDWCAYRYEVSEQHDVPLPELKLPFTLMGEALSAQPRDIVFSLCQYGMGDVWKWGARSGGHYWRTTRDITDTWGSMSGIAFMQNGREAFARPGAWNDLDMLMIGQIWWGPRRRATRLTPDEQYTHLSMWALHASPLLLSCDLTRLDPFTRNLITNAEVLAVNQDSLGAAARRVTRDRNLEVWSRPLADGSIVVGLFNRGEIPAEITVKWSDLGLQGAVPVRDLWTQTDLGAPRDGWRGEVPRHGVKLISLTPPPILAPELWTTDVYSAGKDGYFTYRIPVLLRALDGTLLAFAEARKNNARDAGDIDLVLKRSKDGGATWGPLQVLHDRPGNVAMGNPVATIDRDTGTVHLVYVDDARRVLYIDSRDHGAHFSEPVDITGVVEKMFGDAGVEWDLLHTGPGHGLQLRDGRLIVPIKVMGKMQRGVMRREGVLYSDDHGATWHGGGVISDEIGEISEATAMQRGDGTLVFNIRWHDGAYRAVVESPDGGETWGAPYPDMGLPDQVCQGSILRVSDDPTDERVLFSNLPSPFRGFSLRDRLTMRFSPDDGRTWTRSILVEPGFAGYSDIVMSADGRSALILYEGGDKIYSERLRLARVPLSLFE